MAAAGPSELVPKLQPWPQLREEVWRPLSGGLINTSFAVGEPPVAVVQRLHPIFGPKLHLDIEAVTAHLERKGLLTPRLLPTEEGELWHQVDGRCWRAMTWIAGHSYGRLDRPELAREAGGLVARWHRATADLEHQFAFTRPGAHDTNAHMGRLEEAVDSCRQHRLWDEVAPLAETLIEAWGQWPGELDEPLRVAHGDLKVSNVRFGECGEGLCLVDLDTLGHLPLSIELGDAWRSWCNPSGEDVRKAEFDANLFAAAVSGYEEELPLTPEQREAIPLGIERICLELSARFANDALAETYFGWDPTIAPTRGEHNLIRAQGQATLASSVHRQRRALMSHFAGSRSVVS